MTWIVMIFALLAAAVLQALGPAPALLGEARLPLLLAVVLYYALARETGVLLTAALLAGVLVDLLSPTPLGYGAFSFCLVAWVVSRARGLVMTESWLTCGLFGAAAGAGATWVLYLLMGRDGSAWPAGRAALKAAGTGVGAMVCAPIAFRLMARMERLVGNIHGREDVDGLE